LACRLAVNFHRLRCLAGELLREALLGARDGEAPVARQLLDAKDERDVGPGARALPAGLAPNKADGTNASRDAGLTVGPRGLQSQKSFGALGGLRMRIHSHSSLGYFESCPRQYWYQYISKPPVERVNTIETFLGTCVHETLETLYRLRRSGRVLRDSLGHIGTGAVTPSDRARSARARSAASRTALRTSRPGRDRRLAP